MLNLPIQPRWSDRLAFDVALVLENGGETLNDVIERHNITSEDIINFSSDVTFLKKVEYYRNEIKTKGLTFRLKARAQAEELLTTSWLLIHDPSVSPVVKADLIKSTVRWAGYDVPPKEVNTDGDRGVKITINLGPNPDDARVIEATPVVPVKESTAPNGD